MFRSLNTVALLEPGKLRLYAESAYYINGNSSPCVWVFDHLLFCHQLQRHGNDFYRHLDVDDAGVLCA